MKTLFLALTVLSLSLMVGNADSSVPTRFGLGPVSENITHRAGLPWARLTLAALPDTTASTLTGSPVEFAQVSAPSHPMPISSGMVLGLIAVFVLAIRIMGLNHARALADHERDSYHGKEQMFRSLHAERSGR
jgi:hypothetical protein